MPTALLRLHGLLMPTRVSSLTEILLIMQPLRIENATTNIGWTVRAENIEDWAGHYPRLYIGPVYPLIERA